MFLLVFRTLPLYRLYIVYLSLIDQIFQEQTLQVSYIYIFSYMHFRI